MLQEDLIPIREAMLSDLLYFTKILYRIKTGRDFETPAPPSRKSHYLSVTETLEDAFDLERLRVLITIPPGYGKSTMVVYFIAWAMAQYPDSNFLYISYSYALAEKHTATIKEIMMMPEYRALFGVEISKDSSAKGRFKTTKGGSVSAFGSSGAITGQDAGLPNLSRFSGAVIIDDAHKPDEVYSDLLREKVISNYSATIKPRPRGENVPIIFIGQRLHEEDLGGFLADGKDGYDWDKLVLKSLDALDNPLAPHLISKERLLIEKEFNPYVFWSQHQQEPSPVGGSLFKEENFISLSYEPDIFETFITVDTAETDKTYNDATVFSFWGVYEIELQGVKTGEYALHWIDCEDMRITPDELETRLYSFYARCMSYRVKPSLVAIERKSTGTTLSASLKRMPGIRVHDILRTRASGSKTVRFLEMQPFISRQLITFSAGAKHFAKCVTHMSKITANNTHAHDDICDTAYDAIKLALIDKTVILSKKKEDDGVSMLLAAEANRRMSIMGRTYGR